MDVEGARLLRIAFMAGTVLLVATGPALLIDQWSVRRLHDAVADQPGVVDGLRFVTAFGARPWLWVVVAGVAALAAARHQLRMAVFLLATSLVGGGINMVIKALFDRDRPVLADPVALGGGPSFPSGHAMSAAVCYGAIVLVAVPWLPARGRLWAAAGLSVFAIAIGLTRVALGVHYLSDVLAGFGLGLLWLALSAKAAAVPPRGGDVHE